MDQTKYLMWSKRRSWINLRSSQPSVYSAHEASSWEEQAFAEDTLHIWPPRSYSCTFCRREFRSAQALGGHMNVHRRDRARLRQSKSNTPSDDCATNPTTRNLSPYNKEEMVSTNLKRKDCSIDDAFDEETVSTKRRCVGTPEFPLFVRSNSPIELHQVLQNEVKRSPSFPIEELDLELRLGNCPKVK